MDKLSSKKNSIKNGLSHFSKNQNTLRIVMRIPISLLQISITFINIRETLRLIGSYYYGNYSTIMASASLIAPILGFGLTFSILNFSAYLSDQISRKKLVICIVYIFTILSTISIIVFLLNLFSIISNSLMWVVFLGSLFCLNSTLWSILGAHGWWLVSQLQFLIPSVAYCMFINFWKINIHLSDIVKIQLVSFLMSLFVALILIIKLIKKFSKNLPVNLNLEREEISIKTPFILSIVYSFATQFDSIIIASILNYNSVTKYQLILQLFQPLTSLFFAVILGTRSKYLLLEDFEKFVFFKKNQKYFFKIGVGFFLLNIPIAMFLIPVLSLNNFMVNIWILLIFSINGLVSVVTYSSGLLFSKSSDLPWVLRMESKVLLFINLPLSIIFSVEFGFVGPILGTLLANCLKLYIFNRQGKNQWGMKK